MNSNSFVQFNEQGVPVSTTFDDIYFSVESGVDESQYVFLAQNGLPERWQSLPAHYCFTIAETGFGTGLNFLLAWQHFLEHAPTSARLHFVSFEKFPLSRQQLEQAYQLLVAVAPLSSEFLNHYPSTNPGCHRIILSQGRVILDLWIGDVNELLPEWLPQAQQKIDAWFLDGFAPAKNPEMWQSSLYQAMKQTAHSATTFATFTAAGSVRRALQQNGFTATKAAGFGRKREMLRGHYNDIESQHKYNDRRSVTIIGGGISAACSALSLKQRGVSVRVISTGIADGASGNSQGAVYPLLHAEHTPLSRFYWQAFSTARSLYSNFCSDNWFPTGVMQPAFNEDKVKRYERIANELYAKDTVRYLQPADAEIIAGLPLAMPALHYPKAGWLRPAAVVKALLKAADVELIEAPAQTLKQTDNGNWQITLGDGDSLHAERVVLATGHHINSLLPANIDPLPIQPVRGQVSVVNTTPELSSLKTVLCFKGYLVPADGSSHCVGATFNRDNDELKSTPEDNRENLQQLAANAKESWAESLEVTTQRVSIRATTPDHQPIIGPIAENLHVLTGLGSRGFTSAPILAEVIACQLTGELVPLGQDALRRISVSRFQR
ncbi:bifunctional tRNA (5-methylaminomethyl-2-thiouridine)(34)-methyltransferase MnmD/FAD-dependent 5-carboxymethylaminomethyl-2-thiouridine(34) oxidoreductase MnmC [Idiomarina sp. HP20-50]|uniref:bifunctional tRNA (5-methylaminomethyl-2-thiouridine)(34)-methyltransferase MnmD/FAD-dependent 5-carboxymethylaminomethyl-2-thiouridine(34) oxidoreductase MnmC n=1 Tax=Idiomarina sp. HP20-50 TaxID=3070813 RepID=UPI00294B0C82|nr:bifunctional tRNA (5-methylaminomethyl-2-thiouridine)(34)-methyltransferase MnmD/FAD-dependent 5-carboxymethylaminomethyl-2-thiouridine(34) oxidoreductase MnmC [Idiomarina sp. HP20-50]MDV6316849.1 bifunctional tRNA (5-methylaminomethyl-2-thiouridine)(34)-methyltransferase MnmD/FAD-dependent 5-carboxymethylaminomethyl-2-thiouridine(34) oxidoreductase MnmC [Idiomarina sp. HP20-50]